MSPEEKDKNHYSYNLLLSYNAKISIAIGGGSSIGRTYDFKRKAIKRAIKNKEQFIYLRRTPVELEHFKDSWGDMRDRFPDDEIEIKGEKLYINKEIAGYALSLKNLDKHSNINLKNIWAVFFDDYATTIEEININNEFNKFIDYVDKCNLTNPKIKFILNDRDENTNLYMDGLQIKIKQEYEFQRFHDGKVVVELIDPHKINLQKESSEFYSGLDDSSELKRQMMGKLKK